MGLLLLLAVFRAWAQSDLERDYLYAKRLFDDGMFDLAVTQFRQFAKDYPLSDKAPEALFLAGEALMKMKKYDEARQEFQGLPLRHPNAPQNDQARFLVGECYKALGQLEEAARAYQQVSVFHPQSEWSPKALLEAGRAFAAAGQYDAAKQALMSLSDNYPSSAEYSGARLELARLYQAEKDYPRALDELRRLRQSQPGGEVLMQASLLTGQVLEDQGSVSEAVELYQQVAQEAKYPSSRAQALYRLGRIHQKRGQFEESNRQLLNALESIVESDLKDDVLLALGENYFALRDHAKALQYFKQVSPKGKDSARRIDVTYKMGLAYEALREYRSAAAAFRKAAEMQKNLAADSPMVHRAYRHLIEDLQKADDFPAAVEASKSYLEAYPQGVSADAVRFTLGQIYENQLRDPLKAMASYSRVLEDFPTSSWADDAQFALGRLRETLGDYPAAVDAYENYLRTYPGGDRQAEAQARAELLRRHFPMNVETALGKLADLIGQVAQGASPDEVDYQLALFYLDEVKDYPKGIWQLKRAVAAASNSERRDAMLLAIGRAYEAQAEKFGIEGNRYFFGKLLTATEIEDEHRYHRRQRAYEDSARSIYRFIVEKYPNSSWAAEAAWRLAHWSTDVSADSLARYFDQLATRYPESPLVEAFLLKKADALLSSADTAKIQEAKASYQLLLSAYPTSRYAAEALFKKGLCFQALGDTANAKAALLEYTRQYSTGQYVPRALYLLATLEAHAGNRTEAADELQRLRDRFFYSAYADSAAFRLGDLLLQKGDYEKAAAYLIALKNEREPLGEESRQGDLDFKIAEAYAKGGNLAEARRWYLDYVAGFSEAPRLREAYFALGQIAVAQGEDDAALDYFQRVARPTQGTDAASRSLASEAAQHLGDLYFKKGNYADARQAYLEAAATARDADMPPTAPAQAVVCLYRLGRIAEADKEADLVKKRYKDAKPLEARFLFEKANALFTQKQFDKAEKLFKNIESSYADTDYAARAAFGRAKVLLNTKRGDQALELLSEIPNKYATSDILPTVYLNLGDMYYNARQMDNAVAAFRKVIDDPRAGQNLPTAMQYLVKCYADLQLWERALALAKDFVARYPNSEQSFPMRVQIGNFYMNLNEYEKAIHYLEDLKREAPAESEAEIQYWIGKSYLSMGQFEKAITEFLKVKYLAKPTKLPWDVTAQYEAGLAYLKLGDKERAKTIFQQIVREQGVASNFGRAARQKIEEIEQESTAVKKGEG